MKINIIVGHSSYKNTNGNFGIGINNKLPWSIKEDLQYFKQQTTFVPHDESVTYKNVVVMGRKTWDSIPNNFRPLPQRINAIISRQDIQIDDRHKDSVFVSSWEKLLENTIKFQDDYNSGHDNNILIYQIFIIGGEEIYRLALQTLKIHKLYVTEVYNKFNCDTFIDNYKTHSYDKNDFVLSEVSKFKYSDNNHFRFLTYFNSKSNYLDSNTPVFKNKEEQNYLDLMENILEHGIERHDRTGTGTISTFGNMLKFDLQDTFPISTTKKIFLRGIFEELMMYLRGQTDNSILQEKNIHIWDKNTSREFLDKSGLTNYPEGDMGETYGFNMRHYGDNYIDCKTKYSGGFDQLEYVLYLIKNDPTSRRIIIDLWNPASLKKATLPSCLCKYQFYVNTTSKKLNLIIYIRSSDYFLANNWNTCTGALFVHLICNTKDIHLTPGELTVMVGDTHLYKTHVAQVRENISRTPKPFPKLLVKNKKMKVTDFSYDDICLIGYDAHPRISAEMAV